MKNENDVKDAKENILKLHAAFQAAALQQAVLKKKLEAALRELLNLERG